MPVRTIKISTASAFAVVEALGAQVAANTAEHSSDEEFFDAVKYCKAIIELVPQLDEEGPQNLDEMLAPWQMISDTPRVRIAGDEVPAFLREQAS